MRRLVDTGFLAALPVRRGTRGAREIPYEATGKSGQGSTPGAAMVNGHALAIDGGWTAI